MDIPASTLGEVGWPSRLHWSASASSDPGHPTIRPRLHRLRSQSDPGHQYPDSELPPVAPKPRDVSTVQSPRPLIRGSLRAEAGLSYAETSSTTQSFVSMNSQSGPTDTPHLSTYSVQRLPVEDDDDSDNEADDNAPSTDHHRPNTEDNTIRPPVVPLNTRPTLQDVVRQADPPPFPIPEPFQPLESPNTPPLFPSAIYTQAKSPESEPSRSAKTSTTHTAGLNNSQYPIVNGQGQRQPTTSRSESTTTARPHHSNAIPPPNTHLSPPGEPQSSTPTSPVAIAALPPPPPPKDESDHPPANSESLEGRQRPSASRIYSKYVNMLLAVDDIPQIYNIMAGFFTWILLAGFVLFPGTFTSLQEANGAGLGDLGVAVLGTIQHLPLFIIAWLCTATGAIGMCWLWYRWHANYIWLVNNIFLPGLLNSLAGVASTLANVLGVHHATFSVSSKSTMIVTCSLTVICGALSLFYMFILIRNIKKQHDEEVGKQRAGKHGEGIVDLSKRKMN